jgi:hypothetical protein
MSDHKMKRDWASEFQVLSKQPASFGSDFEHPLERDLGKNYFNVMVPDGTVPHPDYDIFGADFGAGRKKKKASSMTAAQRRKMSTAQRTAAQAGMHSDMGAAGGGGKGGGSAPRAPSATSPSSSYAPHPAAGVPAPAGQGFNPPPGHGLVPPSYSGGTYGYGYPTNRMSPERLMRIEARQTAQNYRNAGLIAEAEAIEAQYAGLYELEDDDFSGEPEKKGFPTWLLALFGVLGIYAGAEYLHSKADSPTEQDR